MGKIPRIPRNPRIPKFPSPSSMGSPLVNGSCLSRARIPRDFGNFILKSPKNPKFRTWKSPNSFGMLRKSYKCSQKNPWNFGSLLDFIPASAPGQDFAPFPEDLQVGFGEIWDLWDLFPPGMLGTGLAEGSAPAQKEKRN